MLTYHPESALATLNLPFFEMLDLPTNVAFLGHLYIAFPSHRLEFALLVMESAGNGSNVDNIVDLLYGENCAPIIYLLSLHQAFDLVSF